MKKLRLHYHQGMKTKLFFITWFKHVLLQMELQWNWVKKLYNLIYQEHFSLILISEACYSKFIVIVQINIYLYLLISFLEYKHWKIKYDILIEHMPNISIMSLSYIRKVMFTEMTIKAQKPFCNAFCKD